MKTNFKTLLTKAECAKLIENNVVGSLASKEPGIYGSLHSKGFTLFYVSKGLKTSFNMYIYGNIVELENETLVTLDYTTPVLTLPFYLYNLILSVAVSLISDYNQFKWVNFFWDVFSAFAFLSLLFSFFAIMSLNRKKNREKKKILTEFLIKVLKLKAV